MPVVLEGALFLNAVLQCRLNTMFYIGTFGVRAQYSIKGIIMRLLKSLLGISTLLLAGCAASPTYVAPSAQDPRELATLSFYRTDVHLHRYNPEKPFFYIDGQLVTKLGTGEARSTRVTPGLHVIHVMEPFAFSPAHESGRIEHNFEAGKEYFIRYSKDFENMISVGSQVAISSKTTLQFANEEMYLKRQ